MNMNRDFSKKTVEGLSRKGIRIVGLAFLPAPDLMPWANVERGYKLDDNGTMRVRSFSDVVRLAEAPNA